MWWWSSYRQNQIRKEEEKQVLSIPFILLGNHAQIRCNLWNLNSIESRERVDIGVNALCIEYLEERSKGICTPIRRVDIVMIVTIIVCVDRACMLSCTQNAAQRRIFPKFEHSVLSLDLDSCVHSWLFICNPKRAVVCAQRLVYLIIGFVFVKTEVASFGLAFFCQLISKYSDLRL